MVLIDSPRAQGKILPTITYEQRRLLKDTLLRAIFIDRQFTERFYERLFELDPSLQALFQTPIRQQAGKLLNMLVFAVSHLEHWDETAHTLRDLGHRHIQYHVPVMAYETVGAALLDTLRQTLGASFTPAVQDAWVAAYTRMATQMQTAYPEEEDPSIEDRSTDAYPPR